MTPEDTANGAGKSSKDDATQSKQQGAKGPDAKSADAKTADTKTAAQEDTATEDAITALKNDHRKVEQLFAQYEQTKQRAQKQKIARQICQELIVHTKLEEEIFYAACREAGVEDDMLDEAQVEHDGAKVLIAELLGGNPQDQFYDAKVKVLSEEIKHHVNEEEKRDGIFAKAKSGGIDIDELGAKIAARKAELLQEIEQNGLERPRPRSFTQRGTENTMPQGQYRDRDDRGRFERDDDRRSYSSRSGGGRSRYEDEDDDRRSYSSRSSQGYGGGSRYEDDDYRGGRSRGGWFGDSESHSQAARQRGGSSRYEDDDRGANGSRGGRQNRERDERGRFMSDDDDDRRSYSSRGGDARYDDDDRRSSSSRGGGQDRDRDERGRFTSDDDDDRRYYSSRSSRSASASRARDEDDGEGRGWYGDREGHSEASRRGWESRSGGGRSRSARGNAGRSRDDDDDDRRGSGGRGSRSRSGHGGWFGDPDGHSEAARRGWENR